jgi:hypothetical protein
MIGLQVVYSGPRIDGSGRPLPAGTNVLDSISAFLKVPSGRTRGQEPVFLIEPEKI